jgi:hypothetical protein
LQNHELCWVKKKNIIKWNEYNWSFIPDAFIKPWSCSILCRTRFHANEPFLRKWGVSVKCKVRGFSGNYWCCVNTLCLTFEHSENQQREKTQWWPAFTKTFPAFPSFDDLKENISNLGCSRNFFLPYNSPRNLATTYAWCILHRRVACRLITRFVRFDQCVMHLFWLLVRIARCLLVASFEV